MKREFYNSYIQRFGKDFSDELAKKINERYTPYLRVNTLKISPLKLKKRLESKGFFLEAQKEIDFCFRVKKEPFSLSSTEEYLLGYFYLQDKASMFPAICLAPKKDEVVLDCCSAPGGKATLLSQLMENKGAIIACDLKKERIKSQIFNIQRLGCQNIASFCIDGLKVKRLGILFDKVLLDAPCSSTGMVWKAKKRIKSINKHEVLKYSELQKKLIKSCFDALKPNGLMAYSTCSLESEENEENGKYAESLGMEKIKEKYFFPHIDNTIGFYYCLLKKS